MRLIVIALLVLAIFVAVWMLVVVPAERRHHDRKLESLRRRIEARASGDGTDDLHGSPGSD